MRKTMFTALAALLFAATPALAQQDGADVDVQTNRARVQVDADREVEPGQRLKAKAMRVTQLMDLEVRDLQNEELGDVEDIVLDVQTGTVRYVALSVGGALGVGDKMFAVPWKAFRVQNLDDEWFLTLNASKEKFENAPGFDKDNWPNFADETWQTANDRFYDEQGVSVDREQKNTVE